MSEWTNAVITNFNPITLAQGRDVVARLVQHFRDNRDMYMADGHKEMETRRLLINPLFSALGWDVDYLNRAVAPDKREVLLEYSQEVEGATKSADYAFRIGKDNVFFVEAKRPRVRVESDIASAFQLRGYGWTAKLPVSLLTDFEHLAAYNCRVKPFHTDKAHRARLAIYHYEQYPDLWPEIWSIYSREAVWSGAFDRYAHAAVSQRGSTEVDDDFLKLIEGWRQDLANALARHNPGLDLEQLNDSVQRTIDRIIFLRMAEDRGLEPYATLKQLAENPGRPPKGRELQGRVYLSFLEQCYAADRRYNSGLFDFSRSGDIATPTLALPDDVLRRLLTSLYPPECPYHFRLLPVAILGSVYERFLGKVIRLTASGKTTKVEDKPEVKKSGGVRYTPAYISTALAVNTVGVQVEGKSPRQLAHYRVLDMACGSGSILLCVYELLLDHYLRWYMANHPEQHPEAVRPEGDGWRLTTSERKRILTQHIFGVDIDRQAVEVTKLSLVLKVLEGESDESLGQLKLFQERALPSLENNIKCGNSLIGTDVLPKPLPDAATLRRVNAFDWWVAFPDAKKAGGFDCIIGNPPYIRIQVMQAWAALEVEIYKRQYTAAQSGNYDMYVVFVEQGLRLLNKAGRLGFILPHKFFTLQYGQPLRQLLAEGRHVAAITHFGDYQIFAGVSTYTCLLFLDKAGASECQFSRVSDVNAWRLHGQATVSYIPSTAITASEWNFVGGTDAALFAKLKAMPVNLSEISDKIYQGLATSADPIYIVEAVTEGRAMSQVISRALDETVAIESALLHPLLKGSEIARYQLPSHKYLVLYPYVLRQGQAVPLTEQEIRQTYPAAYAYLMRNKPALLRRSKTDSHNWWLYPYPKNLSLYARPKILVQVLSQRGNFALDVSGGTYFLGGGTAGGNAIRVADDNPRTLKYLLGLLNSRVTTYFVRHVASGFRGGYFAFGKSPLAGLPVPALNPGDSRYGKLVALVEKILDLHQRQAAEASSVGRDRMQRLMDAADREIDALVYDLYELTPDEIALVEGDADERAAAGGQGCRWCGLTSTPTRPWRSPGRPS